MSLNAKPFKALAELLDDVRSGFACGEDLDEGILQFRMNNVDKEGRIDFSAQRRVGPAMVSKDLLLKPGDILFNSTNSPDLVSKTALFRGRHEPVTFSNHFLKLVVLPRLADPGYLAHFLKWSFSRGSFRTMSRQWVNQASVNKDQLLSMPVPAPTLAEQRRIAAILDQAEALRAKRREALAKLDTLTQSLFLEMFGDPILNPRRWPRVKLKELLTAIESGSSPVCLDRVATTDEWGVLKLGAVTKCTFRMAENKALPPNFPSDPKLEVRAGDLLFSRKNTRELVAACALVEETRAKLLIPDLIFRFAFEPNAPVLKEYLHQLLVTPSKRQEVQKLAGGSAGSMPNISKANLMTTLIELPPLDLQQKFARARSGFSKMRANIEKSSELLQQSFASLQNRAFRGEL